MTTSPGYDGGPFYSRDGTQVVFRGHHPEGEALEEYRALLARGLVRPSVMELYVMDADGSNVRQLTNNGKANFAPFFHPDGKRIIFASNMDDPRGREFDLYMIGVDGNDLERITYTEDFDGFPMFTSDGKTLIFCSNRFNGVPRETNIFVAEWAMLAFGLGLGWQLKPAAEPPLARDPRTTIPPVQTAATTGVHPAWIEAATKINAGQSSFARSLAALSTARSKL